MFFRFLILVLSVCSLVLGSDTRPLARPLRFNLGVQNGDISRRGWKGVSGIAALRGGGEERPKHLELKSPITYITDCKDENGKGRLKARLSTLFPGNSIQFVGVSSDYEAAINLVDIVDAYEGRPGIILANVARREGEKRKTKWANGPPFGWLKVDQIDIFTTIDGYIVSLLQQMKGFQFAISLYDIPSTVPHMGLSVERQHHVINTQFRSFDYLPLLAAQLVGGKELPVSGTMKDVPWMPLALCWVDSFGNIKTNALPEQVAFQSGKEVVVKVAKQRQFVLPCYTRLKDIPDDMVAMTIGSSGLGGHRFLEIVQQGKSAAATLALQSGMDLQIVKQCDSSGKQCDSSPPSVPSPTHVTPGPAASGSIEGVRVSER
mmetsp:Transcript_18891/g.38478  ORF Transcript_18891/g.38478 Transcript_18891/m.38478 type:complete len:376 (-) Transcript_18891:241-1368(-)